MRDIVIEPQNGTKGRVFRATVFASIEADLMWDGGRAAGDTERPVWAMIAGSDQELRSVLANLRVGRKARYLTKSQLYRFGKQDRLEFLKSEGFSQTWQKEVEGSIATLYHPEMFRIDPGMVDPNGITFILLVSQEWHAAQTVDVAPIVQHLKRYGYKAPDEQLAHWAVTSHLFAVYLDRRTRCPLVTDGRFYAQLMLRCLGEGFATFSHLGNSYDRDTKFGVNSAKRFVEIDTDKVGLLPGIAMQATHEKFEELLAQEVDQYFKLIRGRRG